MAYTFYPLTTVTILPWQKSQTRQKCGTSDSQSWCGGNRYSWRYHAGLRSCWPLQGQQSCVRSIYIRDLHAISTWLRKCGIKTIAIHRGVLDTAVLPSSGGRAGCCIDQRKGREEHNGEENRQVRCRIADVAAPVRIAQGKFPTAQRHQTDEDTHPSSWHPLP